MEKIIEEVIKTCIPIIVGALIAIVPSIVEKQYNLKKEQSAKLQKEKQEMYLELISLISKVIKEQNNNSELEDLRNRINLVSITGSTAVVKTLNEYINTWGNSSGEIQNQKYTELLKAIRLDLQVDKKLNEEFPQIGVIDITIK